MPFSFLHLICRLLALTRTEGFYITFLSFLQVQEDGWRTSRYSLRLRKDRGARARAFHSGVSQLLRARLMRNVL